MSWGEPPSEYSIAHDYWEIWHGDIDAFRNRWAMGFPAYWDETPDREKRRLTSREYMRDILGIDEDG